MENETPLSLINPNINVQSIFNKQPKTTKNNQFQKLVEYQLSHKKHQIVIDYQKNKPANSLKKSAIAKIICQ